LPTDISIEADDPESTEARACLQAYYDSLSAAIGEVFDPARARDPDRAAAPGWRGG